ncbi:MAG: hypothetical protein MK226_07905 [Saprospiraceae bacterium]|nr:hypothetical protein [Saprospiraceae bacterium]
MKNILKWLFFILIGLLLTITLIGYFYHQPLPIGEKGAKADKLARQMMDAMGKSQWDSTMWLSWSFAERHSFVWDKDRSLVKINWDDYEVLLEIKTQKGNAYKAGKPLEGDDKEQALKYAWAYFCNDTFWLVAPLKAFDPGTERRIVTQKDGSKDLLITYSAGGVTPGDSYLWQLDESGMPTSYQMWVGIIPIGGIKASWENWTTTYAGAKIAKKHQIGPISIYVKNLQSGESYIDLGFSNDPFQAILN